MSKIIEKTEKLIEIKICNVSNLRGDIEYGIAKYNYEDFCELNYEEKNTIIKKLIIDAEISINSQLDINSKFKIGDSVKVWKNEIQDFIIGIVLEKNWLDSKIEFENTYFYSSNDKIYKI